MTKPFIQQARLEESPELQVLLRRYHNAFVLLTVIAQRARRTRPDSIIELNVGEALVGDHATYGMSQQEYRTAKKQLQKFKLATFKATTHGTVATLSNTRVYDINADEDNEQPNSEVTGKQQAPNKQVTGKQQAPNKQVTTKNNEEGRINNEEVIMKNENGTSMLENYHSLTVDDSKNDSSNPMEDDSSSQGNTISQGNPDSQDNTEYQEIAKELAEIVTSAKNIKVNTAKIKQWGNEIRKLHSVDGIEPGRMRSVLSWYSSNIGGEYVPIVESGKSFRSKFLRLENAVKRDSSNPSSSKPRPKPEFIDTSIKTFQEVYNANKVSRTDMFQEYCNIPLNTLLLELGEDDVVGVCPRICVDGQFMRFTAKRIVGLEKYSIRVDWVSCLDGLTKFSDFYPFAT